MRAWLAKRMLTRNLLALNAGDYGPTLRADAPDVHFRFPGDHSWAADVRGREQVEQWLKRMVATGLQHDAPEQVVVSGPPWRMTVCLRGSDWLRAPTGELVYENRYVIWSTTSWGRVRAYEVYQDTQKAAALDEYLAGAAAR